MTDRRRWILVAAVLGSGIVFLDSTVVNVALPRIGRDLPRLWFGVLEGQSYVYNAYLLTLSALLILAGALTDFYGRKRMFIFGLIGFGATSVLCGLAPNMELLVLFRIFQGAAGALLVPGSLALITANFEGEAQGRAFGIWAGASGATTILGPVVGGFLVDSISWRAAFLINVPLILVALWATYQHVPERCTSPSITWRSFSRAPSATRPPAPAWPGSPGRCSSSSSRRVSAVLRRSTGRAGSWRLDPPSWRSACSGSPASLQPARPGISNRAIRRHSCRPSHTSPICCRAASSSASAC